MSTDIPRDGDAEQLSSLIAAWAQKRRGKAVSITFHRDDAELLFRTIDARDAAMREKDGLIAQLREEFQQTSDQADELQGEVDRLRAAQPAPDAAAERAAIVANIKRFESDRMDKKKQEEAEGGDPAEAEAFWNQVIAARMIRKRIERGEHAQPRGSDNG